MVKEPKGLEVVREEGRVRLIYRHHRVTGCFLVFAGLFWMSLLPSCWRVLSAGDGFGPGEALAMCPFLLVTFGFLYVGLAKLLNRTEIDFTRDQISVSHHPLPWFGSLRLPMEEVQGYQVKRDLKPQDARHRVTVALVADRVQGPPRALLRAISDSKAARRMHEVATEFLKEIRPEP